MKKKLLNLMFLCLSSSFLFAQSPNAARDAQEFKKKQKEEQRDASFIETIASTITSKDLREHLTIIASDEFEGRETGEPGNDKAAKYIANHFRGLGLPTVGPNNDYFQPVIFTWTRWNNVALEVRGKKFRHLWDYVTFPERNNSQPSIKTDEVIFLGYGIDDPEYSDYKGVDVKDKVILIYKGEPVSRKGKSQITGTKTLSEWSDSWEKKLIAAKENGVKTVLIIENQIQKMVSKNRNFLVGPKITLGEEGRAAEKYANSYFISTSIAKEIMGGKYKKVVKARKKMQRRGKSKAVTIPVTLELKQDKYQRQLIGNNVLGYVEGSDPKLKHELVVLTAHYDHLGKKGDDIFNGADDNGSGTSTILEVAEAFAKAKEQGKGARRSVLLMLVTGEEKGLLGSQYYVERPIFPLKNTIVDINVDMVGRVDEKYKDNPNYVYVIGSDRLSTELHEINESVNKKYTNLTLDYTYNAESDPNRYYYRSDHYNFAEKGIPAIFYFNGTHADYHRSTDTVEKINFEKMETIGRLVFHTAWELANRDKRIIVDVKQK
ncbi:MAG: M28 family peptidase [Saprospiraceae bacterium]